MAWVFFRILWRSSRSGQFKPLTFIFLSSLQSINIPTWKLESWFVQRDPIFWVSTHRYHHQFCDSEKDPHSPIGGFWFSHTCWIFDTSSIVERVISSYYFFTTWFNISIKERERDFEQNICSGIEINYYYYYYYYDDDDAWKCQQKGLDSKRCMHFIENKEYYIQKTDHLHFLFVYIVWDPFFDQNVFFKSDFTLFQSHIF